MQPCCSRNTSRPSAPISISSCFPSCCSSRCFLSVTSSLSTWWLWLGGDTADPRCTLDQVNSSLTQLVERRRRLRRRRRMSEAKTLMSISGTSVTLRPEATPPPSTTQGRHSAVGNSFLICDQTSLRLFVPSHFLPEVATSCQRPPFPSSLQPPRNGRLRMGLDLKSRRRNKDTNQRL